MQLTQKDKQVSAREASKHLARIELRRPTFEVLRAAHTARPKWRSEELFHWLCGANLLCAGVIAEARRFEDGFHLCLPPNFAQDRRGVWLFSNRPGHRNLFDRAVIEGALSAMEAHSNKSEADFNFIRQKFREDFRNGLNWIGLDTMNIYWQEENYFPLVVDCPRCGKISKIESKLERAK